VVTAWGSNSPVAVQPLRGTRLTVRRGAALRLSNRVYDLAAPLPAGSKVATLTAIQTGRAVATWQVATSQAVTEPSPVWRVTRE
jgi:hypothetical protein